MVVTGKTRRLARRALAAGLRQPPSEGGFEAWLIVRGDP